MVLFRFYGRVLPSPPAVKLNVKDLPPVHWENNASGVSLDVKVSIVDSELIISCESASTHDDIGEVYRLVFDTARSAVNCFAYIKGMGLSVIIDRVIPPDGIQRSILVERPELARLVTAFEINPENKGHNFDTMRRIVNNNPELMLAIDDLIASISISHHGPINCARAIETIREVMTPIGADRTQGWKTLRDNLNLDKSYLTFITDISTAPRHGKRWGMGIPQEDFDETIKRAWIVVNRFFEYKKRGDKPLPSSEFPPLS